MIDDLMRDPAVILQDVVVFGAGGAGDAFRDGLFPPTEDQPRHIPAPVRRSRDEGGGGTKISRSCSSGISVSFAPWCLGITSCVDYSIRIACNSKHHAFPLPRFQLLLVYIPNARGGTATQTKSPPRGFGSGRERG